MNIGNSKKLLTTLIKRQKPVLLVGQPGCAKTSIVKQTAETLNIDLLILHPVISDPTDFKGFPFRAESGKTAEFLPYGDLAKIMNCDKPLIVFFDDLGQAPASVQAAAMQLLLAREINGKQVSDLVTFVAATNRREDKAGVSSILEPVKGRFHTIIHVEFDIKEWVRWGLDHGLPADLLAFAQYLPDILTSFKPTNDIKNSPTPRNVANAGEVQIALEEDGIFDEVGFEALEGAAGTDFSAQYMAFRKIYRELPNPSIVLADPENFEIPEKADVLYALCSSIATKANKETAGKICTFASRLEGEFSVFLIMISQRTYSGLVNCREFIKWAEKYGNDLI